MKTCILIFLFSLGLTFGKNVQSASYSPSFQDELLSPVITKAQTPFLTSSGITLVAILFEDQIVDPTQSKTLRKKRIGTSSKWGDLMGQLVPNAFYSAGMAGFGWLSDDQTYYNQSLIMVKATAYATILTNYLKILVREPRPNKKDRKSFPSGHTTAAFAFASVIGAQHGPYWGIPAYALAAFVGYSRMYDNAHWIHDVLGGAAIGIGYGLGISFLAQKASQSQNETSYFIPIPTKGGLMLSLGTTF